MKFDDLLELAKQGKLTIEKSERGKRSRRQFTWNKDYSKIIGEKTIYFIVHRYSARTPDMDKYASYRITAKDYKLFKENGAKLL